MKNLIYNRCAILDDGCSPRLVKGANFDGLLKIPFIHSPKKIIIPPNLTPFSKRNRICNMEEMICFNEYDEKFSNVLIDPDMYIDEFKRYGGIIGLDCSLYRNAPPAVQVANIYRTRALGSYFQRKGIYVIPFVRWGDRYTYTTEYFPEKIAFLGIEKHSIVAIGTYGCIKTKEDKTYFSEGLEEMMKTIEPIIVLVYGSMPKTIFGKYLDKAKFVQYDDWTTRIHKERRKNG